jgi:hypothetical protein
MSEGDWVNKVCKGKIEYTLDNKTRVDCQMPNESQEYDWQNKWYECFGQALYYGQSTRVLLSSVYSILPLQTLLTQSPSLIFALALKLSSVITTPIIVSTFFINDKWKKYSDRALKTIKHYKLPIKLYIIKPNEDFTTVLYTPPKHLLGGKTCDS